MSADPDEMLPLRPSDLLYGGNAKPALPGLDEVMEKTSKATANILSERWKHQQGVIDAFWKRYRREYLLQLKSNGTARPVKRRGLKVGDVVLIDDPAASRSYWPMARVQSLHGGEGDYGDGKKRTAVVRLPNRKTLRRPNQLLYPLEISEY